LIHVEVLKGKPPILRIDIAGNVVSIIVLTQGSSCRELEIDHDGPKTI